MGEPPRHPEQSIAPGLRKLAGAVLLVVGGLLLLAKGILPGLALPLGDFANYYTASRLVVDRQPLAEAYVDPLWFQKQIDAQGIVGQLGGFVPHPPPAALVMVPLTPFSPLTAKQIWTGLNLVLLGLSLWMLGRLTGLTSTTSTVIALLSGPALWHNFAFGQLYVLLLFSLLGSLFLQKRGRPIWAGICLGLLIPVKYFGAPWLVYWAWRRDWKLVVSGLATATAVTLLTLLLVGPEPFLWFWRLVAWRHLAGEIQDPFAAGFQSWNSLYRRLFVFDPLLNPAPAFESNTVFVALRQLTFWMVLAWGLSRLATPGAEDRRSMADSAWLISLGLLLSPAGASYHFVLLIPAAAYFAASGWRTGNLWFGGLIAAVFCALNLPHFLYLAPLAEGWWNLIAYSRLWLMVLFVACGALLTSRAEPVVLRRWLMIGAAGFLISVALNLARPPAAGDGARLVTVDGPDMDLRFGLIMSEPQWTGELVFTYVEGAAGRYSPYDGTGHRWTPPASFSYFHPQLHTDGRRLLVETWGSGTPTVGLSTDRSTPEPVGEGRSARWLGREDRIIASRAAGLTILGLTEPDSAVVEGEISDFAPSPDGRRLAYCRPVERGCRLMATDLELGSERVLIDLASPARHLDFSPDGTVLAFSRYWEGNWDIWTYSFQGERLSRLTRHPAVDAHPTWTSQSRLIFASDRGRGLGFSVLYELEVGTLGR